MFLTFSAPVKASAWFSVRPVTAKIRTTANDTMDR